MSQQQFQDQVVLVTGGTGALGSAVSTAFLGSGAHVAVTYRKPEELDALRRTAGPLAANLRGVQLDITVESDMQRAVAALDAEFGRLDVLINTAGGYAGGRKLWLEDAAVLEQMLAANLRSAFVACRCALPLMLRRERGAIVSVAARAALLQPGGAGAYVASKAALLALMHSLALDLKGSGIRVNSILPNVIDTAANRRDMPGADFGTWTRSEDIARVVLFLCSADSQAINAAAIPV
jgi:NAD(P)-dependent dehydrogenase (short-subunit alcohol dehydrogenase family)